MNSLQKYFHSLDTCFSAEQMVEFITYIKAVYADKPDFVEKCNQELEKWECLIKRSEVTNKTWKIQNI